MSLYTPLQQRAYDYMKELIVNDQLEHGEIYSEMRFARELNISRTPVREALQRLSQEGYVDIIPSKGFVVHSLTERDVISMYQARIAIEHFCLAHYAVASEAQATQELLGQLKENIQRQYTCQELDGGGETFYTYDCEFHGLIISHLDNQHFLDMFEKYLHQFRLMTKQTMTSAERIRASIQEHEEICQIVQEGRPMDVFPWLHQHIDFATQCTLDMVRQQQAAR